MFARKSVNEFNIAADGEETEYIPTFCEDHIKLIFEAKIKDLGLDFKTHQYEKFKDKCNKVSVNRKAFFSDVTFSCLNLIDGTRSGIRRNHIYDNSNGC